eukprot:m.888526 g.888526  ORF g.888526 m.888526 type:complete len:54 (+) comp59932_c0_seq4:2852-3013(+)
MFHFLSFLSGFLVDRGTSALALLYPVMFLSCSNRSMCVCIDWVLSLLPNKSRV